MCIRTRATMSDNYEMNDNPLPVAAFAALMFVLFLVGLYR